MSWVSSIIFPAMVSFFTAGDSFHFFGSRLTIAVIYFSIVFIARPFLVTRPCTYLDKSKKFPLNLRLRMRIGTHCERKLGVSWKAAIDLTISAGYCSKVAAKTGSLAIENQYPIVSTLTALLTNFIAKENDAHHLRSNCSDSGSKWHRRPTVRGLSSLLQLRKKNTFKS